MTKPSRTASSAHLTRVAALKKKIGRLRAQLKARLRTKTFVKGKLWEKVPAQSAAAIRRAAARKKRWAEIKAAKAYAARRRKFTRTEFAVFTLKFRKPDNALFSASDKHLCIEDGEAALTELFAGLLKAKDAKIEVKCVASGDGTFWADFSIIVGVLAALGPVLHILGLGLEKWGSAYEPKPLLPLVKSGEWLQGVAWRITPQAGSSVEEKRPGCFGLKEWLDRRTKRCRPCGFLTECAQRIEGKSGS